jgi:hypothetical protein
LDQYFLWDQDFLSNLEFLGLLELLELLPLQLYQMPLEPLVDLVLNFELL